MTNLFGVNLNDYFNNIYMARPVLEVDRDKNCLMLRKNLNRLDDYPIQLTKILGFNGIEPKCYKFTKDTKVVMNYTDHLRRIKYFEFDRALSPQEYYAMAINRERGHLNSRHLDLVLDDISHDAEEYLCHAFQKANHRLKVFEYVNSLLWDEDNKEYVKPKKYWNKGTMDIDLGYLHEGIHDLEKVNRYCPKLIEYLFNCDFDKLPAVFKFGPDRALISIPEAGPIWPMVISVSSRYSIGYTHEYAASRGVRKR